MAHPYFVRPVGVLFIFLDFCGTLSWYGLNTPLPALVTPRLE